MNKQMTVCCRFGMAACAVVLLVFPVVAAQIVDPDLVASDRGGDNNSPDTDLGSFDAWTKGSSTVASSVSGAMALLMSAHPGATVESIEHVLESTAVDLGAVGPDSIHGYGRIDLVVADEVLGLLRAKVAVAATTYTDEGAFLAAVGGLGTTAEGFEDTAAWGGARSPDALGLVTSKGITWTSNHDQNMISTSGGAARLGDWGLFSNPHGDQTVPNLNDFIADGFSGISAQSLAAVGGWFRGSSGSEIVVILDGDEANPIGLGSVSAVHTFFGVVADGGFTTFEFRETEGTFEDQKYIFVDDVTFALSQGGTVPVMDGVVAGAANLPGALGSDWHTDLFLHNASSAEISVELFFSPEDGTAGNPGLAAVVSPDETLALEDVVATFFEMQGSGAIFWRVAAGDPNSLVVNANTFNRVNAVQRYGQQVSGVRWGDTAQTGSRVLVPALAGRYRTNLGVATDGDCSVVVVRGYDRTSTLVAQRTYSVQPWSWIQLNSLFRRVFPNLIDDPDAVPEAESIHRFEVTGIDGRVVTYTSIIDNTTSDGSYMVGQVPGVVDAQWLPGAAVVLGVNESNWRSDVMAISTAGVPVSVGIDFFPVREDNSGAPDQRAVPLEVGESAFVGDILGELFGYSPPAVGSLAVSSAEAQPMLWMRTYTEEAVAGADTVTYGQAILPRTAATTVAPGASGTVAGFSQDDANRSNLILQNTRSAADGSRLTSEVRIELLEANGTVLHERTYVLLPGEYRQHNRFVEDYGVGPVKGASLRVTVLDRPGAGEMGGVDAMVSEVNGNSVVGTNDSRLVRAETAP